MIFILISLYIAHSIRILDTLIAGKILQEIIIDLKKDVITVEELIKERVFAEVEKYTTENYNSLVELSEDEKSLRSSKNNNKINPEKQSKIAIESFRRNGFIIIIDDMQVESLKDKIRILDTTEIRFVKLVPLIGG